MADDADSLLSSYGDGKMSFKELCDRFENLTPPSPKPAPKNWGEKFAQAEEGDDSIAAALYRAEYAGDITAAEEEKLFDIYSRKNPTSPL